MMPVYIAAGMSTLFSYNNIMYAYLPTYSKVVAPWRLNRASAVFADFLMDMLC